MLVKACATFFFHSSRKPARQLLSLFFPFPFPPSWAVCCCVFFGICESLIILVSVGCWEKELRNVPLHYFFTIMTGAALRPPTTELGASHRVLAVHVYHYPPSYSRTFFFFPPPRPYFCNTPPRLDPQSGGRMVHRYVSECPRAQHLPPGTGLTTFSSKLVVLFSLLPIQSILCCLSIGKV